MMGENNGRQETLAAQGREEAIAGQAAGNLVEQTTQPYVGRWNRLVSTTNWEKGRIIAQWRDALLDAAAPAAEYSDEAWSRRVGGVSGQHVGRLRRVYQRFGQVHSQYEGLYWSHFQAALDWEDAEMWLEGARLSNWSVSQMRHQRWEALGAVADQRPGDQEVVLAEWDEDFEPALREAPESTSATVPADNASSFAEVSPAEEDDDQEAAFGELPDIEAPLGDSSDGEASGEPLRPFQEVGELPEDVASALDMFKLAILHHKSEQWRQVAREDVLRCLDGLRELALAE